MTTELKPELLRVVGDFYSYGSMDLGTNIPAWNYFHQTTTTPVERYYLAGANSAKTLTTSTVTINTLYALPYISGTAGLVDRFAFNITTGGAAGSVSKMAIYDTTSIKNLYPNKLLISGTEAVTTSTGVKTSTVSFYMDRNTLYWFVFWCGVAAPVVRSLDDSFPILGIDNAFGTTNGLGWSVTEVYATNFPSTFTASASIITNAPLPAMGVRYSA